MKSVQYEDMVAKARQEAQDRIAAAKDEFGLGTYGRYEVDLSTAKIRFLDNTGVERINADIQVAGSWSPDSESWLWVWDNESVPQAACSQMAAVRSYGENNNIRKLQTVIKPCDEGEAWSMASISAHILNAQCIYRVVRPANQTYILLFSIRRVL